MRKTSALPERVKRKPSRSSDLSLACAAHVLGDLGKSFSVSGSQFLFL